MRITKTIAAATLLLLWCCNTPASKEIGSIERTDAALDALVDKDAHVEILAQGYDWTEGPVWVEKENMLLYSDIPPNKIYKWTEAKGAELYLTPSGYTDSVKRGGEVGSNGLAIDPNGSLILCQHGDRRIAMMDAPLNAPAPKFTSVADRYNGKRFNSPNDLAIRSNGDIFFTDPPYGLEKGMDDPLKETPYQGVYKESNGTVTLLIDSITRPNGIALANNEKQLIVANSDGDKAYWYVYDIGPGDSLLNGRIWYDVTAAGKNAKGSPDGFKIDRQGNVFATGPGGIWIFNKDAKLLGKIKIPEACSNVALADNDKTLFITADMYLLRVKLRK